MENKSYSFTRDLNGVSHQFSVNVEGDNFPNQGVVNCSCGKEHPIGSNGGVFIGTYMTTWDGEFEDYLFICEELSDQSLLEKEIKTYSFVDTTNVAHSFSIQGIPKQNSQVECSCGEKHPFLYERFFLRLFKNEEGVTMHEDFDPITKELVKYNPSQYYWNPASKPY